MMIYEDEKVRLTKTAILDGRESNLPVGSAIIGRMQRNFAVGKGIRIRATYRDGSEESMSTSPVTAIEKAKGNSQFIITTATSVYVLEILA